MAEQWLFVDVNKPYTHWRHAFGISYWFCLIDKRLLSINELLVIHLNVMFMQVDYDCICNNFTANLYKCLWLGGDVEWDCISS